MANVAELLCRQGLRVLMVDFDLEAPGLEQYFYVKDSPQHKKALCARGIIDLLISYKELRALPHLNATEKPATAESWEAELEELFSNNGAAESETSATNVRQSNAKRFDYPVEPLRNFIFPVYQEGEINRGELLLMSAGRRSREISGEKLKQGSLAVAKGNFSPAAIKASRHSTNYNTNSETTEDITIKDEFSQYAKNIRSFSWDDFYLNWDGELFFDWFRKEAMELADVVLVDSRTGVAEMSGVCTYQLADVVVMFVAMNNQNIDGAQKIADSLRKPEVVIEGRGGRELSMLFVPSRVESGEGFFLDSLGSQFRDTFSILVPPHIKFTDDLFIDLKVPYKPFYAFTEEVAARDPLSPKAIDLVKAFNNIIKTMVQFEPPDSTFRSAYQAGDQINLGLPPEEIFTRFSLEDQHIARGVLTRMVQVSMPEEGGRLTTFVPLNFKSFSPAEQAVIKQMADYRLLTIAKSSFDESSSVADDEVVRVTDENVLLGWQRFKTWLDEDHEFLVWRQQTKAGIEQWRANAQDESFLLTAKALELALSWREKRKAELSDSELLYITESIRYDEQQKRELEQRQNLQTLQLKKQRRRFIGTILFLMILGVFIIGALFWQQQRQTARDEAELKAKEAQEESQLVAATSYIATGNDSLQNGNYDEALNFFTRAISAKPDYATAYVTRGDAYLTQQRYDEALADFDKAIQLDPANARAYNGRGVVYRERVENPNLDLAIENFNQAIRLKPDDALAYGNRGIALSKKGDRENALKDLNQAVQLKDDYAEAFYERAKIYNGTNRFDIAAEDYRRAAQFASVPAIQTDAQRALDELVKTSRTSISMEAVKTPTAQPRIFLHFNDKSDVDVVRLISNNLKALYGDVRGVELRDEVTRGDVRYFYAEDREVAEKVRKSVQDTLAQTGSRQRIESRFLGRLYRNVPRGQIEVWIPSLKDYADIESPATQQTYQKPNDAKPRATSAIKAAKPKY